MRHVFTISLGEAEAGKKPNTSGCKGTEGHADFRTCSEGRAALGTLKRIARFLAVHDVKDTEIFRLKNGMIAGVR